MNEPKTSALPHTQDLGSVVIMCDEDAHKRSMTVLLAESGRLAKELENYKSMFAIASDANHNLVEALAAHREESAKKYLECESITKELDTLRKSLADPAAVALNLQHGTIAMPETFAKEREYSAGLEATVHRLEVELEQAKAELQTSQIYAAGLKADCERLKAQWKADADQSLEIRDGLIEELKQARAQMLTKYEKQVLRMALNGPLAETLAIYHPAIWRKLGGGQ